MKKNYVYIIFFMLTAFRNSTHCNRWLFEREIIEQARRTFYKTTEELTEFRNLSNYVVECLSSPFLSFISSIQRYTSVRTRVTTNYEGS